MNMIRENRLTRYVLYALGEIFLVVIGILIALQINAANQYRNDRKEETFLLRNLNAELQKDILQLERNIAATQKRSEQTQRIMSMLQDPEKVDINEFISLQDNITNDNYFVSNRGVFDEGVSSGKMKLIQNDSLRSKIFNYYRSTSNERDNDNLQYKITNEQILPRYIEEVVSTREVYKFYTGMDIDLPALDLKALASNKNYLTAVMFSNADMFQVVTWQNYKKLALELREEIEGEDLLR